ncbi:MAG: hypothetical protein KGZ74_09210 [Chitinophagaceae bacterium]|nr:hypothetical protein [Chitinophagaceae bacterium]
MSGSNGGSGFAPTSPKDCNTLKIYTQLASPDSLLVGKLKIGEILAIRLIPPTGPVHVLNNSGEIVGAILSKDVAKLIECISDGHEYRAKVLDIKGGNCQVIIAHI